jgi:iron complex transport system substrate-binding protein
VTGHTVTIEEPPTRVVTLNPSAAQTMWEIGAKDRVVGVSQYATYLDGADEKTNVSGAGGPSVEKVIDAEPDLVLVPNTSHSYTPDRIQQIRDANIPVYVFGTGTSLEFVANKTETTGRLVGECSAGRARADEMRRSIEDIEAALADESAPVGLNVFYGYTSGANTFIGSVMETGGLENGAASEGITGFQMINDETVVKINPDWIVTPSGASVPNNPAYNSTTAVKKDQIIRVNTNYLQQPAPRVVRAVEVILKRVHPDAYQEYKTGVDPSDSNSETGGSNSDSDDSDESDHSAERGTQSTNRGPGTPGADDPGTAIDLSNQTRLQTTGNATVDRAEAKASQMVNVTARSISANETVSVEVSSSGVQNQTQQSGWGVERVNMSFGTEANTTIGLSQVDATNVEAPLQREPSTDSPTERSVIGYLNVSHTAGNEEITSGEIVVRVNETALQNTSAESVTVYRYHNGTWTGLNTTALGDGRFRAETPGFSTFAIATSETASELNSPTPDSTTTATSTSSLTTSTERALTTAADTPGFGYTTGLIALTLVAGLLLRRPE